MKLPTDQQVLSLLIASSEEESVLVATENGFGKRTILSEFRKSGRGTQGVKANQLDLNLLNFPSENEQEHA